MTAVQSGTQLVLVQRCTMISYNERNLGYIWTNSLALTFDRRHVHRHNDMA